MQVAIDYQPAVAQRAGIGRYTRLLAHHLPACLDAGDSLRLFYFDFFRKGEPPDVPAASVRPWRLLPGAIVQQLWKRGLPPRFDRLAGKADLYHFCNFIIPPISPCARTVVTIYDMSFMRHPECAEAKNLAYMSARIGGTVARADAILTISAFSAAEIESFFPAARGKVFSVYPGVDQSLAAPPPARVAEVRRKYGLKRPYILSVGTVEPRKNYGFLADAFGLLRHDVDLVVAGRPGWRYGPTLERFAASPKAKSIRLLTSVGDGDLAALYAGAELFAISSLYEGFGFPPLEAMLCGTPVVSSPGGSLAEVLGDAAEVVPEFDAALWAETLDRALSDSGLRATLRERGFRRAARYRWEETARETAEIYRRTAGGGNG